MNKNINKTLLLQAVFGNKSFDGYVPPDEILEEVLNTIHLREQRVLQLRFGIEDGRRHTLREVSILLNVSGERIRQIEAKALRKLRHPSRSQKLWPIDKRKDIN